MGGTETNTSISGRVEIFVNGYWSTVCSDGWNRAAARTVCNQLGYKRLTNAYMGQGGVFGRGSGPILEGVQCSKPRMRICTCLPDSPPSDGCDHSKDVSVACASMWTCVCILLSWICTLLTLYFVYYICIICTVNLELL